MQRDCCNHLWLNFEAKSKFVTVSVRLMLPKGGVDSFNQPRREINIRSEFDFQLLWETLGSKQRWLQTFLAIFETTSKFVIAFVRLIKGKIGIHGLTGLWRNIYGNNEFGLRAILKSLGWIYTLLQSFLSKFASKELICHCLCHIDIARKWVWPIYRTTTAKWIKIRKYFLTHIKDMKVEIEVIGATFQWCLKQQVNF